MRSIETDLTRLLGCRVPLICAPMAGVSFKELAISVSLSGGFGFIGQSYQLDSDQLKEDLDQVRKELGITDLNELIPIGIGILGWYIEKMNEEDALRYLTIVLKSVKCLWISFGKDLKKWVKLIHQLQKKQKKDDDDDDSTKRCKLAVVVSSLSEAENLFLIENSQTLEIDIIVGQGHEAGGHGGTDGETINALIPLLRNLIIKLWPEGGRRRPTLVAAGGLTHGAHLVAMLALGASGIVCGTRFLATPEARYTDAQKQAILKAKSVDTIKTTLFDELRGTIGWPKGINGRALKNETIIDHLSGKDFKELETQYQIAMKTGDVKRLVTWSGTSVGLVSEIISAKKVVQEIEKEAISIIISNHSQIKYH
ncbi:hypothetical protein CROQUDRAFT_651389 [Cronartium quercuum f. sp. fusiforme G11]|uniref:Nitronate monooxygenase domain-containing protein n=1 Tax=Cronartium quercuum f. sp. fusiforme G11 TaxID=708437 RepID=A0A9P6NPX3_9BASI|nr:hypothetical protein CROQUDRAFT_651389 [Cronartium quercuum f. sp. fusiforme G11]